MQNTMMNFVNVKARQARLEADGKRRPDTPRDGARARRRILGSKPR